MITPSPPAGPRPGPDPASAVVGPARAPSAGRIPSLDGLRAVSVALVVFSHLVGDPRLPAWARAFTVAFRVGRLGVAVFFAISGFLITTLLLQERAHEGRVRLGRFYLRRTLRIFPPFYVYCGVLALLAAAGVDARVLHPYAGEPVPRDAAGLAGLVPLGGRRWPGARGLTVESAAIRRAAAASGTVSALGPDPRARAPADACVHPGMTRIRRWRLTDLTS